MNKVQIKNLLKEIFQQIAPDILFDELDTSHSLRGQADIDSFDFYRIIVQISERTGIKIPDSKLAEMNTLDQLISFISEKIETTKNGQAQSSIL